MEKYKRNHLTVNGLYRKYTERKTNKRGLVMRKGNSELKLESFN